MASRYRTKPLWECSRSLIEVAQGRACADLVVKNARLVNVCTAELQEGTDVAIAEGRIAYVGKADHCIGDSTRTIDAHGLCIAPGFLDGHIHVESSMIGVGEYARAVVPHGTTGIYWDPHEVCNVLGLEGLEIMAQDACRTPLKTMITIPSCIPAVPGFEDTGSAIDAADIARTIARDDVAGLGEMMNFPGILACDENALAEVAETLKAGKTVTGHFPVQNADRQLNAYIASGIRCCHESTRAEDALAKLRLGMYAQMRLGSAWQDLPTLASAVLDRTVDTRLVNLVSDDTHPHTLVEKGHVDHIVRTAVDAGIDPITAIQMVTLNVAQCFHMDHEFGSIAPGKCADIVFLDDLESLQVVRVLIDGEVVAENGEATFEMPPFGYPSWVMQSVHLGRPIEESSFRIPAPDGAEGSVRVRAVQIVPNDSTTREAFVDVPAVDGLLGSNPEADVLKAFVFERHRATGTCGHGFVKGFGIKQGAMASTVAHDAHNLLVIGSNDRDMAVAANALAACGGGMVVVAHGEVVALVELPIAGLMDALDAKTMSGKVHRLEQAWESIGCTVSAPFMAMSFLALACLPEIRLTNRGLVDCRTFEFVDPVVRP